MIMNLSAHLVSEIEATHGELVATAARVFFANLPAAVVASGQVGQIVSGPDAITVWAWSTGLMDGLETYLKCQGIDPLTALRVREYLWTYWSELGSGRPEGRHGIVLSVPG